MFAAFHNHSPLITIVKPLNQQLPTFLSFRDRRSVAQQCWIRLHSSSNIVGSTHAHYTWSAKSYRLIETFLHCTADPNIVRSCCTRLQTTANTDATTPNIIGPTLFDFLISLRLHDYDGHCPKAAYVWYRTSPKECKFHSFCNWIQSLEIQPQKNFLTLYKWHRNDTVIK